MNPRIIVVNRVGKRSRTSIRKAAQEFRTESRWAFVIELLLFALLVAISVWPMIHTAEALRLL
jgi:hypothetical protein